MKKFHLTLGLFLSMCVMAGCSNDDEPSSGSGKVSGSFQIDGKTASVKYGYEYKDGNSYGEYWFLR